MSALCWHGADRYRIKTVIVVVAAESKEPTMTHMIPGQRHVIGVTSLGNRLFVLSGEQVTVYESMSFEFQQKIKIPGLKDCYWLNGLTSSGAENCLFVSDCQHNAIYRIDWTNDNEVSQWPTIL
jgi:hypothetical protein